MVVSRITIDGTSVHFPLSSFSCFSQPMPMSLDGPSALFLATALKAAAIVSGSVSMNVGPSNIWCDADVLRKKYN